MRKYLAQRAELLGAIRLPNNAFQRNANTSVVADILFLQKDGYRIELVSPYAPDSVVSGLIRTYKNAPYHLCYEAENFEKELAELEGNGYIRIDEPTPAPAIGGRRVVFLMHPAAGMLELLEEK